MNSPLTGKEMPLKNRTETLTFRKESFSYVYHYYYCEDAEKEYVSLELADLNLNQVYNQYRTHHHIPFPEEIIAIRSKYELPANKMAEVLGFGINIYRNYENGEIPSESNAKLITLSSDPHEFRRLLLMTSSLSEKDKEKALQRVNHLIAEESHFIHFNIDEYIMGETAASEFTGYRLPSIEKALQVVVYFAKQLEPWLTSLNKLLFYADFGHYKRTGQSITGLSYRAINYGVVPRNYSKLFAEAVERDLVEVKYKEFVNANTETYFGQQYSPSDKSTFDESIFDESELKTLNRVSTLFAGQNANNIVNANHKEKAWLENFGKRQLVSYQYSFDLQNI